MAFQVRRCFDCVGELEVAMRHGYRNPYLFACLPSKSGPLGPEPKPLSEIQFYLALGGGYNSASDFIMLGSLFFYKVHKGELICDLLCVLLFAICALALSQYLVVSSFNVVNVFVFFLSFVVNFCNPVQGGGTFISSPLFRLSLRCMCLLQASSTSRRWALLSASSHRKLNRKEVHGSQLHNCLS